ncbi:hypothetical protein [Adhaeribacter rhizoryzae]|uniref:Uncharacterized protein n=1 Tax=Adhaeribacter rhizoryzae TaxID=2607907 RepID=A0A5M6DG92_9BACT|nr:hypothetical protein [Adhaeribacter rhizoryzae]KAA5546433.1 hypothetical protein F0145_11110 [Adhaeribacter rhizoryzae]
MIQKYVEEYKANSIGKKVKCSNGNIYLITGVSIWDTLDRKRTKLLIDYYGKRISKTGKISEEQSRFFPDKRNELIIPSWFNNDVYFEEKKELLKQYTKLRANFSRENKAFKKGDKVKIYSGEHFIIESTSFCDTLTWKNDAFFSYRGRMILKSGKLSNKSYNLYHNHISKLE